MTITAKPDGQDDRQHSDDVGQLQPLPKQVLTDD